MWERVGNSFVTTAVLNPSETKPKAARKPAPPEKQEMGYSFPIYRKIRVKNYLRRQQRHQIHDL